MTPPPDQVGPIADLPITQNLPALYVIESGSRWLKAWRFFLAHPPTNQSTNGSTNGPVGHDTVCLQSLRVDGDSDSAADFGSLDSHLSDLLRGKPQVAIFWEISADVLLARAAAITKIRRQYPDCLQLAGTNTLSSGDLAVISELGVAASARAPEDLPRMASMLQRFMRAQ